MLGLDSIAKVLVELDLIMVLEGGAFEISDVCLRLTPPHDLSPGRFIKNGE